MEERAREGDFKRFNHFKTFDELKNMLGSPRFIPYKKIGILRTSKMFDPK